MTPWSFSKMLFSAAPRTARRRRGTSVDDRPAEVLETRSLLSAGSPAEAPDQIAPVIGTLGPAPTYVASGAPVIVTSTATVFDGDSVNFNGGSLVVSISANVSGFDRLQIRNQGTGSGQIGVSGANVLYEGNVIGTFTVGAGSQPLSVNFTSASATSTAVQALVRNVEFRIATGDPTTAARTVAFSLNDGVETSATASKSVNVDGPSADPVIGSLGPTVTYSGAPILLAGTATVTDSDSSNLNGGSLTARISSGASRFDRVEIRNQGTGAGQIGVIGSSVTYGGVVFGTFAIGTGGSPLTVNFTTAAATEAAVQALLQNVQFRIATGDPTTTPRTASFQVNDGDGGVSAVASKSVVLNQSADPVVGNLGATVNYSGTSVVLAPLATLTDSDTSVFNGGSLAVRVSANASGFDRVEIRNQGTGTGQVGISGTTVTFGGVAIGTFAVGTGGSPLTVNFNSNAATTTAVRAVLRNVTFRVASGTPSTADRTLSFQVNDGQGGLSTAVSKTVTVS